MPPEYLDALRKIFQRIFCYLTNAYRLPNELMPGVVDDVDVESPFGVLRHMRFSRVAVANSPAAVTPATIAVVAAGHRRGRLCDLGLVLQYGIEVNQ